MASDSEQHRDQHATQNEALSPVGEHVTTETHPLLVSDQTETYEPCEGRSLLSVRSANASQGLSIPSTASEVSDTQETISVMAADTRKEKPVPVLARGLSSVQPVLWIPSILHRRALFSFVTAYLILIAALETIYQVSKRRYGLVSTAENKYYLWTYGPTALLTLLAAIWARVEYRTKQMAPWKAMFGRFNQANQSVLLDYVSSWQPIAIVNAMRAGDYAVALVALESILIIVLIVISTGLLSLTSVLVKDADAKLKAVDRFTNSPARLNLNDTLPLDLAVGILDLNLPLPLGTDKAHAFQSIDTSQITPRSVLHATVDGFSADFVCEEAELNMLNYTILPYFMLPHEVTNGPVTNFVVTSKSCSIKNVPVGGIQHGANTTSSYGLFQAGQCINQTGPDSHRILLAVGETFQHPSTGSEPFSSTPVTITRALQLLCKSTYSIKEYDVSTSSTDDLQTRSPSFHPHPDSSERMLPNVHAWDIAQTFFTLVYIPRIGWQDATASTLIETADTSLYIALRPRTDLTRSQLFDAAVLKDVARTFYQMLCAQFVKAQLMSEADDDIDGSIMIQQDRLVVRLLPTRLMESILALTVTLTLAIMMCCPKDGVIPRDPGTVAGFGSIVANQVLMLEPLRDKGAYSKSDIRKGISSQSYRTGLNSTNDDHTFATFYIEAKNADYPNRESQKSADAFRWWQPFPVKIATRLAVGVCILLVIIALELVLRLSQRKHGLADVKESGYVHYAWSFVPAAVMISISLYFNALDFTVRLFAPFLDLKHGSSSRRTICMSLLDKIALHSIWESVRSHNIAALTITLGTILGSYLTIVVSGVYSTTSLPLSQQISIQRQDAFNLSYAAQTEYKAKFRRRDLPKTVDDGAFVAGLIVEGGLPYPAGTYDELALPKVSLSAAATKDLSSSNFGYVTSRIPAIRSELHCTFYQGARALLTSRGTLNLPTLANFFPETNVYLSNDTRNDTETCATFTEVNPPTTPGDIFGTTANSNHLLTDCPLITYYWGKVGSHGLEHVAALSCNESIGQIQTDISWSLPRLLIDTSRPPLPDESTIKFHKTPRIDTVYYDLPTSTREGVLDQFFQALVYGKGGLEATDLANADNNTAVIKAIHHLHRIIRAQQWSGSLRVAAELLLWDSEIVLQGTATNSNRLRLVQNPISTRVLESLLGSMLLCMIVSAVFLDTKVLPKNPCSIAAMASLLAGSRILELLPPGSEWMSQDELEQGLRPYRWKMGWSEDIVQEKNVDEEGNDSERSAAGEVRTTKRFTIDIDEPSV